jgi:hypothetical protein
VIAALQAAVATATSGGTTFNDSLALLGGNQSTLVFLVSRLSTSLAFTGGHGRVGLACGCAMLGGKDEFCGDYFNLASSSAIRASSFAHCCS